MASAASAAFRLTCHPKTKPPQHLISPFKPPSYTFSPLHKHTHLISKCTNVSKEDKPILEPTTTLDQQQTEFSAAAAEDDGDFLGIQETEAEIDKRRLEEKFAVLNTGIFECRSCGYLYNEAAGDPSYPIAPGIPFDRLPEDWRCATCGAAKTFFQSKSVEIAGFAQNQQFGLGGNTLTGGQKAILIYGSLLFFFVLFLSGYFLQ